MTKPRWTPEELAIVGTAPNWASACAQLPHRSRAAVRNQWAVQGRGTTRSVAKPSRPPKPLTVLVGRPPQTPDECRVAQIIWHARQVAQAAGISVDAQAFLDALRASDWRRFGGAEGLQALPLAGWSR